MHSLHKCACLVCWHIHLPSQATQKFFCRPCRHSPDMCSIVCVFNNVSTIATTNLFRGNLCRDPSAYRDSIFHCQGTRDKIVWLCRGYTNLRCHVRVYTMILHEQGTYQLPCRTVCTAVSAGRARTTHSLHIHCKSRPVVHAHTTKHRHIICTAS